MNKSVASLVLFATLAAGCSQRSGSDPNAEGRLVLAVNANAAASSQANAANQSVDSKPQSQITDGPAPSLASYTSLPLEDFAYMVASHIPNATDENLSKAFIPGYRDEPDSFKRHALMEQNLGAVKAKLAIYASQHDFVVDIREADIRKDPQDSHPASQFDFALGHYDFGTHSFPIHIGMCANNVRAVEPGEPTDQATLYGHPVSIKAWGQAGDPRLPYPGKGRSFGQTDRK